MFCTICGQEIPKSYRLWKGIFCRSCEKSRKRRRMGAALQVALGAICGALAMASVCVHHPSLQTAAVGLLLVTCSVVIAGSAPYAHWAFVVANQGDGAPSGRTGQREPTRPS